MALFNIVVVVVGVILTIFMCNCNFSDFLMGLGSVFALLIYFIWALGIPGFFVIIITYFLISGK